MKKNLLVLIEILLLLFLFAPRPANAVSCEQDLGINLASPTYPYDPNRTSLSIQVSGSIDPSLSYTLYLLNWGTNLIQDSNTENTVSFLYSGYNSKTQFSTRVKLMAETPNGGVDICRFDQSISIIRGKDGCNIILSQNGKSNLACYDNKSLIFARSDNVYVDGAPLTGVINLKLKGVLGFFTDGKMTSISNGIVPNKSYKNPLQPGNHTIVITNSSGGQTLCEKIVNIRLKCDPEDQEENSGGTGDSTIPAFEICSGLTDEAYDSCNTCNGNNGVWTALGCIHYEPQKFITDFLKIALGIAGGIALLLMIYGSFLISTSAGDPKKAEEGKEIITGTIAGLLFIIFSVFLLKLIGVDILQIPNF